MKWIDIPQFTRAGEWECTYSLKSFVEFIEEAEREQGLIMNPDFQRGHVWTEEQQIAYVEFLLRGGKTARTIYLNHNNWNTLSPKNEDYFVNVDGLQRYTSVRKFVYGELKVFDRYYHEFEGSIRTVQGLNINVNNLQTREEVLQWYIDFNSGGTVHTKEEIDRVRILLEAEKQKYHA